MRLSFRRIDRRCHSSLTLLRDALIYTDDVIIEFLGAVSAQSGRQFDEKGYCFFGGDVV
jgi:hypothetical protein